MGETKKRAAVILLVLAVVIAAVAIVSLFYYFSGAALSPQGMGVGEEQQAQPETTANLQIGIVRSDSGIEEIGA